MANEAQGRPTVLITGVAGYIGGHTALACLDAGWRVVGIDDLSVGRRETVPDGVEFHALDCGAAEVAGLIAATRPAAAIHFAALISVEESVREPLAYYEVNVARAARFFGACADAGLKALVFSSTAAVYGETDSEPVGEDYAKAPISPYGRSKLAAEWILRDLAAARGLPHVIFRYFNVAGADPALRAGPRAGATHLIKKVCEAATGQSGAVTVNGTDYDTPDGTCVRDYIHVTDLAEAHLAAVRHLLAGGESATLNCGYGRGYSVREVIEAATPLAPVPFEVRYGPRRPGDVVSLVAANDALKATLDWTPRFADLGAILKTAIDWDAKVAAART